MLVLLLLLLLLLLFAEVPLHDGLVFLTQDRGSSPTAATAASSDGCSQSSKQQQLARPHR